MNRFYTSQEMAKISCHMCAGCGSCCQKMGDTVHLDPYDVYQLTTNLKTSFTELLEWKIALHVEEGVILPHLKMDEESEACVFLQPDGTCNIHEFRPGICRLFPLGRNYDGNTFQYFIVENGCTKSDKSKVKISKWLNVPDIEKYEKFVASWHYFIKEMQLKFYKSKDEEYYKKSNLFLLQSFFIAPYDQEEDFYEIFEERLRQAKKILK